MYIYIAKSETL